MRQRVLQNVYTTGGARGVAMRDLQTRRILLRQRQQDMPTLLGVAGSGQERARLFLQTRFCKREHADRAGVVRGLPRQLLLHGEGGHDTVCDQRGVACAITGFDKMLLRLGMERN